MENVMDTKIDVTCRGRSGGARWGCGIFPPWWMCATLTG